MQYSNSIDFSQIWQHVLPSKNRRFFLVLSKKRHFYDDSEKGELKYKLR